MACDSGRKKGDENRNPAPPVAPKSKGKASLPVLADVAEAEVREEAAQIFMVCQFLLFLLLGVLINRLRVVFGPPMMMLAACCLGPRLFPWPSAVRNGKFRLMLLVGLGVLQGGHIWYMSSKLPCISDNEGVCTHFGDKLTSDGDLADLFDWVNNHLAPRTPVLASMNLAGSLRLFTSSSLIIHPQFESANLRARVQRAYELYHCDSEEGFAETMKSLHVEVVVFEYQRCFFTPYDLDDKRKNCDEKKHRKEDQLCVKLHVSDRFKLIFANAGYAVFRLVDRPDARPLANVNARLGMESTWQPFLAECAKQGEDCGPRLMEMAGAWHHSLKRPKEAKLLRGFGAKLYPNNGYVSFHLARQLDFDEEKSQQAGKYYEQAAARLPNNAVALKEYLMWLDMVGKDNDAITKLLQGRHPTVRTDKATRVKFSKLNGTDSAAFLCEAGTSALQLGLDSLGRTMWNEALSRSPFNKCIKHNWPLIYPDTTWEQTYDNRKKMQAWIESSTEHDMGPHNSPAVRFTGEKEFALFPARY